MPATSLYPEIGLALSGGGFRATLFHIGSLWRLNELGLLRKVNRVCSVSGGSITAGFVGLRWKALTFSANDIATNFPQEIAQPLRHFCTLGVDVSAGLEGILSPSQIISDRIVAKYRDELFGNATLQDLPDDEEGPRFVIYATSLQTGSSFRLSRPYLADYKIGLLRNPTVPLASAVAASSAFPPVLSPVILETDPAKWEQQEGAYLYANEPLRRRIYLSDGGVYDNLGLEAIWDRCETVLVSDAGAPIDIQEKPSTVWHEQTLRCLDIITEQTRALRKRKLVADFQAGVRKGTYWGITTHIGDYQLADSMASDNNVTASLKAMRTRLNPFSEEEQGHLINWGYALTDAAMRKHVIPLSVSAGTWPVPEYPL